MVLLFETCLECNHRVVGDGSAKCRPGRPGFGKQGKKMEGRDSTPTA
jgi:hypothetical protein